MNMLPPSKKHTGRQKALRGGQVLIYSGFYYYEGKILSETFHHPCQQFRLASDYPGEWQDFRPEHHDIVIQFMEGKIGEELADFLQDEYGVTFDD